MRKPRQLPEAPARFKLATISSASRCHNLCSGHCNCNLSLAMSTPCRTFSHAHDHIKEAPFISFLLPTTSFPHPWILKQADSPPRPACNLLLSFLRILPPRLLPPFPSCCFLHLIRFIILLPISSPVVALLPPKQIFLPTTYSKTLVYSLLSRRKHGFCLYFFRRIFLIV